MIPSEATATTRIVSNASLDVLKAADESTYSSAGDLIHYTIIVTNTGNVTITDIDVTDPLTGLSQTISSLQPGAYRTFNQTYSITQRDVDEGVMLLILLLLTVCTALCMSLITDEEIIAGSQTPQITLTKSANPTTYSAAGNMITYTITVQNTSNVTLTNILVTDPLTGLNQIITSLAPGQRRTLTSNYRITQDDLNRGYVDNTALAEFTFKGTPYSESASTRITANIGPDISITKRALESSYTSVGNILHYNITVRNTGNVTLTDILVTDPLTGLSHTIGTLDPGESADNSNYLYSNSERY